MHNNTFHDRIDARQRAELERQRSIYSASLVLTAAQAAIDWHKGYMRLEDGMAPSTDLWHLIRSLIEWCDTHGVDFDATVSEVRQDFAETEGRTNG